MQCGVCNNTSARLHVTGFREGRGKGEGACGESLATGLQER